MLLKEKLKKINPIESICFFAIVAGMIWFILAQILTDGEAVYSLLFVQGNDMFNDFFHCIYLVSSGEPLYGQFAMACYPPLAFVFYKIFGIFIPEEVRANFVMNNIPVAILGYFFVTVFGIFVFSVLIWKLKKGNYLVKILFLMGILFSVPFIYLIERGNLLLYSISFLLFFLCGYDSPNKGVRECANIALVISAVLKIYPVFFGILLLREKRYAEIGRCILYGLILFFVPFFIFGDISQFGMLISNIKMTNADFSQLGTGYRIDLSSTIVLLMNILGVSIGQESMKLHILKWFIFFGTMILSLLAKEKNETILFITLMIVMLTEFSWIYNMVYLIIPLIFYANEDKCSLREIIDTILILITFIPITLGNQYLEISSLVGYSNSIYTLICGIALITLLSFSVLTESVMIILKRHN